jgi:hypothetical protein
MRRFSSNVARAGMIGRVATIYREGNLLTTLACGEIARAVTILILLGILD